MLVGPETANPGVYQIVEVSPCGIRLPIANRVSRDVQYLDADGTTIENDERLPCETS